MIRDGQSLESSGKHALHVPEDMPPSYAPEHPAHSVPSAQALEAPIATPLIDSGASAQHKGILASVLQMIAIFAIALLCTVLIKEFLVQSFTVPSGSMASTIMPGDYMMVNKLADKPQELHRGDVVVFEDPGGWLNGVQQPEDSQIRALLTKVGRAVGLVPKNSGTHLVKRIIGMGGDHITCCTEDGLLAVNGVAISEPYINNGTLPSETPFDVTVPEGYLWVMGDNRSNSEDSRAHQQKMGFGFVPVNNVEGRAFLIYYPISRVGRVESGSASFSQVPDPVAGDFQ